jgi:hypothetical protein
MRITCWLLDVVVLALMAWILWMEWDRLMFLIW